MRVYCETFGCTMNLGDTELILGHLKEAGHEPVNNLNEAEIIVVNTCGVKGPTQRKVLRRLKELSKMNGKKIIVAGCLPLIDLPSIERAGDFAGIITCHSINLISKVVDQICMGKRDVRAIERKPLDKPCMPKFRLGKVSAIISVSEGCVSNCSYCSVKFARGRLHSFNPKAILDEVRNAVKNGYKEILLTSQDMAAYGMDVGENLPGLLKSICSLGEKFKVRVGMMNPANVKGILNSLLAAFDNEKIYKFLHLPVQSGDDGILASMRRGYTVDEFLKIVNAFKERFEDLYLATDIIVGFPGEGEMEFDNTVKLIKEIEPDKVNITRFSPMPRTEAARMKQVEGREVKRRSRKLSEICRAIGYEKNKCYVGRITEGLVVEGGKRGGYVARLPNYKPAILGNAKLGDFVKVKIIRPEPTYLLGEVMG
jgi:MiaB-like tRNA modifying enzyme